jgi:hypothetical protein
MTQHRFNKCPLVIKFHVGGGRNIRRGKSQMSVFSYLYVSIDVKRHMSTSAVYTRGEKIYNSSMTAYISSTSICRYISTFSTCALKLWIGKKNQHDLKSFCNQSY